MLGTLYGIRSKLSAEIRADDEAAAAHADELLRRRDNQRGR